MVTLFSNQRVGTVPLYNIPIFGNLEGNVVRTGNTVSLIYMRLHLYLGTATSGLNRNLTFTVNYVSNSLTLKTTTMTADLGYFSLSDTGITVAPTLSTAQIAWSSSDGFNGTFDIIFPAPPNTPTVSASDTSFNSTTITYGTSSWGSPNHGTVALYGATTTPPATQIASSTTLGSNTFIFTGLEPETTYYFRAKASNGEMDSSYSTTISVTTDKKPKFYGSVNGKAKLIKKMYCEVNGKTKLVTKFYGSVNGQTKRIF